VVFSVVRPWLDNSNAQKKFENTMFQWQRLVGYYLLSK
jgi:hypothetical protein